ncbi:MAG TPA: regulatory signaling modulator protein AmpE, partial [Casimicrobiaceae bacterium]|nr:regulatory signaling modulator protein AmpE [Casimicrobiaceae bacterium]
MNFLAIVAALALEQWRAFQWRGALQRAFVRYGHALERRFNAGTARQGAIAAALALLPPVALGAAVYWALDSVHPVLALAWNIAILYLLLGFRHFSHAFSAIAEALAAGDALTARRHLSAWCGIEAGGATGAELPKLAIEQGIRDSYRHVFGTLFWFLVLPGPVGALLYRLTSLLADHWRGNPATPMGHALDEFGKPVRRLLHGLDWVPVRATAVTFAIVGDFEDAIYCW